LFAGDLGSGTTKIFFQKGLDKPINHFCFSEDDLPVGPWHARGSCAGKLHAFPAIASPYFRGKYIGKSGARGTEKRPFRQSTRILRGT
jgi:hypothetical protein